MSLCYRRAKGWTGARVFESHGKCHRRIGAGSDTGMLGEKHRRTQSEFEKKLLFCCLLANTTTHIKSINRCLINNEKYHFLNLTLREW